MALANPLQIRGWGHYHKKDPTVYSHLNVVKEPLIRNDISTNAQTLKHNINNVCNLIKLKQAI